MKRVGFAHIAFHQPSQITRHPDDTVEVEGTEVISPMRSWHSVAAVASEL